MFSWPSGAKVSWSRAPPPKVITTTLRLLEGMPVRAIRLEGRRELPNAIPAVLRKNSRRIQERWRASYRGVDALAAARRARSTTLRDEESKRIPLKHDL